MIYISHRGNIDGKIPSMENHPSYIDKAIALGYGATFGLTEKPYRVDLTGMANPD